MKIHIFAEFIFFQNKANAYFRAMLEVQGANDGVNGINKIWFLIQIEIRRTYLFFCYFSKIEMFQDFWP